jgi:hypothetical protein
MKKYILCNILLLVTAKILAQGTTISVFGGSHVNMQPPPPYDGKTPPLLKIDEAYTKVLSALGSETNQYYCVSTTCMEQVPRSDVLGAFDKGWKFEFSNTNGVHERVLVYFDGATRIESPAEIRNESAR